MRPVRQWAEEGARAQVVLLTDAMQHRQVIGKKGEAEDRDMQDERHGHEAGQGAVRGDAVWRSVHGSDQS